MGGPLEKSIQAFSNKSQNYTQAILEKSEEINVGKIANPKRFKHGPNCHDCLCLTYVMANITFCILALIKWKLNKT